MNALNSKSSAEICVIEAFYGGSHKQLIDLIEQELKLKKKYHLYTMSAKKWHWRARCSALHFSQIIPMEHNYKILFTSSVLNLSELVSLRKDLRSTKKVVYFHENQLVYPIQSQSTRNKNSIENKQQRDFQYGYNQILTSLVADVIFFNSNYNRTTFLSNINSFLKQMPDYRVRLCVEKELAPKCRVLYFPINLNQSFIDTIINKTVLHQLIGTLNMEKYSNRPISILWSHRWEHDKNPSEFFNALFKLEDMGIDFRLNVVGEQFAQVPDVFNEARQKLGSKIEKWGYLSSKLEYFEVLSQSDIIISTSLHEFFGVSVIEACMFGAYPILPNRLVYPELYPKECLYSTETQLVKKLKQICSRPKQFRLSRQNKSSEKFLSEIIDTRNYFDKFKWDVLKKDFISIFEL
ncbi:glycosyltransferase-like domain-containing 1-like [Brachionus plicatilis]|uniref:tRNA-queuosine alpha-mannosyltransferase n=1 Tax=Brachionus plicatilis TaxID=10195 RepID=A0A3M7S9W4_BRAPC|nr:glycosyltransferase-like domain-containing 1-like [Brachionus plicatilis]